MGRAAVASFLIDITISRSRDSTGVVNLFTKFMEQQSDQEIDIVDIFEQKLSNPLSFRLLDSKALSDSDQDAPSKKIELEEIYEKGTVTKELDGKAVNLYKYLHFSVKYGENGDKALLEKASGEEIDIDNDDYQHRIFHAFLAYPYDTEVQKGVLILESRGAHSIQGPIRKVLKNCVADINGKKYTLQLTHFVDESTINSYIDNNQVSKLRLYKEIPPTERGDSMRYQGQEIIFYAPRGSNINNLLKVIYHNNYFRKRTQIAEIDNFEPDIIKFEVKTESGVRTYTSGRRNAGLIQRELPDDVVGADGITYPKRFLTAAKSIYESEHINHSLLN